MRASAMRSAYPLCVLVLSCWRCPPVRSDFIFNDFNATQAIIFNGHAGTTSCVDLEATRYGKVQGIADRTEHETPTYFRETLNLATEGSTTTDDPVTSAEIKEEYASFNHLSHYSKAKPTRCGVRCRLTPSGPSAAGSIWYHIPLAVNLGFETIFTFQVSDHSRECSSHKDPAFSTRLYKSCAVHGGDGFAFVIHRDENDTRALGESGQGMGYEGIRNSLAVEFDTWYNPDTNTTATGADLVVDHIAVHSRSDLPNSASESASLGQQRPHPLADGRVHMAKVTYLPYVAMEYMNSFTATPSLVPFLKDNDEKRRVGTLLVFIDEGIEEDSPIIAIPINLSVLLSLPQDQAYVGFTASTGLKWEKHDILSWIWCDKIPCDDTKVAEFDYNQESKISAAAHYPRYGPGKGYGGGKDTTNRYPRHQNPDTEPVSVDRHHHASRRKSGLLLEASKQVPPEVYGERFGTEF